MLCNKKLSFVLFVIFCDFNKALAGGHGHGHSSHGGSHRGNSHGASPSSTRQKTGSSYFSDDNTRDLIKPITYKPITYDSFNSGPAYYSKNLYKRAANYVSTPSSNSVNELDDFFRSFIKRKGLDYSSTIFHKFYAQPNQPPTNLEGKHNEEAEGNNLKPLALNQNVYPPDGANALKVRCNKQMYSDFNERGEIVDSVREICKPIPTTTAKPTTSTSIPTTARTLAISSHTSKPYVIKEKRYERIIATTVRGINCRKVMNSELNDLGEIVDSVNEVCDPPTTTTTTTRKPTIKTTTRRPITTPKPLVKVCRPVMNSYLNDEGEIIDSVTEVCTMEPVK